MKSNASCCLNSNKPEYLMNLLLAGVVQRQHNRTMIKLRIIFIFLPFQLENFEIYIEINCNLSLND